MKSHKHPLVMAGHNNLGHGKADITAKTTPLLAWRFKGGNRYIILKGQKTYP